MTSLQLVTIKIVHQILAQYQILLKVSLFSIVKTLFVLEKEVPEAFTAV